jgi:hypothetical protein
MAYLPKSNFNKKYTNGLEFAIVSTGEFYVGPYLELSDGTFYAGDSLTTLKEELIKFEPPSIKIAQNPNTRIYGALNNAYVKREKKYIIPVATRSRPTAEDYVRGSYMRYFLYKEPTKKYIEVDFKTYKETFRQDTIDRSLFKPGKIKWALKGDTQTINGNGILKLQNLFPNLISLFNNLTEYTIKSETENLTAKANELVYLDGSLFPEGGKYHLHPEKGPMEGAFHKQIPHETLRFVEEKPIQTETQPPEQPITPPPAVSRPTSYGGRSGY